ncbi:MAG: proteasome subunit alpha [Nitrospinae bacterium RIFCSPLOWO2_12_FULL_47_7]|nr:MAG: proteasome subunit alpha [Nitrospinae bacterium RIFCSPLOWO2_12_FULL_47_7]
MFEEPFRWIEAISTRHSYVREKLGKGQPVIAVPFNEGALLMGFSPQPGKIFEIYDRIAMGGLGHPADVEKLRMTLLDLAHIEGFNRSEQDVNISRLLQFGIAPALKQNFEEVMRAPYLVQLLLVELDQESQPLFYRLNYDGHWETFKSGAIITGNIRMAEWIDKEIPKIPFSTLPLDQALQKACNLWEEGHKQLSDGEKEKGEEPVTLKEAFKKWNLESAILSRISPNRCLYRAVTPQEIEQVKKALVPS